MLPAIISGPLNSLSCTLFWNVGRYCRSRRSCVASRCGRLRFGLRIRLWGAPDNVRISSAN